MIENTEVVLFTSAARTATTVSDSLVNRYGREIDIVLDVTVRGGSSSIVMTIDYLDAASGKYVNLLTGAAVVSVSTNRYRVHPNLTAATNLIAQAQLPRVFRITITHGNADSITYSVGYRIGVN